MKPPRARLAFWENKIPHWGVCYRPDGCTPEKSAAQGEVAEEETRPAPPSKGKMKERECWRKREGGWERGREELMPTAQQRPPPPPRAQRSTGKGAKVKGTSGGGGDGGWLGGRGFKFKATVSVCVFNSRATPSQRSHAPTSLFPPSALRVEVGPRPPSQSVLMVKKRSVIQPDLSKVASPHYIL